MTSAFETIKGIVSNRVAVMNTYVASGNGSAEALERWRNELCGMMICLKNLAINENGFFYNINYCEDGYEFGYYDEAGKWYTIVAAGSAIIENK